MKANKIIYFFIIFVLFLMIENVAIAEYPTKPITIVVPWSPGGSSDLAARTLTGVISDYIGKPVVAVNNTGAGGIVGSSYVFNQKADGYTLLLTKPASVVIAPVVNKKVVYGWDTWSIIGILELNPFVFVVNSKSPYNTLDDLTSAVKKNPGKLSYSHSGPSTVLALSAQMLLDLAGINPKDATSIPYKGGGEAKVALLGGHVDFLGCNLSEAIDQIKGGQLRALAVTTKERFEEIPNVPTVKEAGYPDLENLISWSGIYGPPGLSGIIIDKWMKALQDVKNNGTWIKMTKSLGSIPYILTPDESKIFVKNQYEMYNRLCSKLGIEIK